MSEKPEVRLIDANALLDDMQELLNQEVLGNTISDVGVGIEIAMYAIKRAKETTLNTLRDAIYEDAVEHGLWERTDYTLECCMERAYLFGFPFDRDANLRAWAAQVVHRQANELEQAEEAGEYAEELADVIIASLSVAGKLGIDIDAEVRRKMQINRVRPWKHGKDEKK